MQSKEIPFQARTTFVLSTRLLEELQMSKPRGTKNLVLLTFEKNENIHFITNLAIIRANLKVTVRTMAIINVKNTITSKQ